MLQDEDALLDARYTRRSKLRTKLDTLTFTESMCKAVSKYDVNSGKPFLAYFDAIYANAMHDSVNSKAMRDQGDMRLSRREGQLWKRLCELCEKQGLDPKNLPAGFLRDGCRLPGRGRSSPETAGPERDDRAAHHLAE